jgi:hypothetical protein
MIGWLFIALAVSSLPLQVILGLIISFGFWLPVIPRAMKFSITVTEIVVIFKRALLCEGSNKSVRDPLPLRSSQVRIATSYRRPLQLPLPLKRVAFDP